MNTLKTTGFGLLLIFTIALVIPALSVDAAIYMKYDGVKGDATATQSSELQVSGTLSVSTGTFEAAGVVGNSFVLDGSQSQDDARRMHKWRQTSGPVTKLADEATMKPTFTPSTPGTYIFELVATDSAGKETVVERAQLTISAKSSPSPTPPVIDGGTMKGETTAVGSASGGVWKSVDSGTGDEKLTPVLMEIEGVKGESKDPQKGSATTGAGAGKVKMGTEQEAKGEKGGTEDINIGVGELQGGGIFIAAGDVNGLTEEEKTALRARGMNANVRSDTFISDRAKIVMLDDDAIQGVKVGESSVEVESQEEAKLFGFISIPFKMVVVADLDDVESPIKVKLPWWSFLASVDVGDETFAQGKVKFNEFTIKKTAEAKVEVLNQISNILKTKHDTAKNAIGNIR